MLPSPARRLPAKRNWNASPSTTLNLLSANYPFIDFKFEREIGNDILMVEGLTKKGYFENLDFIVQKTTRSAL